MGQAKDVFRNFFSLFLLFPLSRNRKEQKERVGKGSRRGLLGCLILPFSSLPCLFDIYFFWFSSKGIMASLGVGICVCILFIFTVMNYYIWTLMITFKFTLKQIYKNSFKFVFINMKFNLLCFFSLLLVYAVNIGLIFLFQPAFFIVLTLEIFLYILLYPSFRFLLVQFCTFPSIKKYIIDPYYLEHPDEDIDKRRDLGIEVEEKKPQTIVNENGEEESENVFED